MTDQLPRRFGPVSPMSPVALPVVISTDDDRGIVLCDLGTVLDVWSGQGGRLRPDQARELGVALIAWADRRGGAG
jgi:hypothetical protein